MTIVDYDLTTLEGLEFEVACDFEGCDVAPEWHAIMKCCGTSMLICDPHLRETLECAAEGTLHMCWVCETTDIEGNPFAMVDKM